MVAGIGSSWRGVIGRVSIICSAAYELTIDLNDVHQVTINDSRW